MQVIELQDPIEVLRISNEIEITFYDAAYVVAALRRDLILVTDDRRPPNVYRLRRFYLG